MLRNGLAQSFIFGEKFIDNVCACLVLGDHFFYCAVLNHMLYQSEVNDVQNNNATFFISSVQSRVLWCQNKQPMLKNYKYLFSISKRERSDI